MEVGNAHRRVCGDRRRSRALAPPSQRPGPRVSGAPCRGAERGSGFTEGGAARARLAQPRPPARIRAADRRPALVLAGARHLGRLARSLRGACADGAAPARAGAAHARATAADERDRAGAARRGARRRRRPSPLDGDRSAEEPLRPRVRREPASGARARVSRGLRRRPGRADVPAAPARRSDAARCRDARAARRRADRAGGSCANRTSAAAARGRRRDRAPVAVVSTARDRRVAAARSELLRARRDARDHRAAAEARGAAGIRRGGRRRRRSTISSTTWPCCGSCCRSSRVPASAATRITCSG